MRSKEAGRDLELDRKQELAEAEARFEKASRESSEGRPRFEKLMAEVLEKK